MTCLELTGLSQALSSEDRERHGYGLCCKALRTGETALRAPVSESRMTPLVQSSVHGSERSSLGQHQGREGSGQAQHENRS